MDGTAFHGCSPTLLVLVVLVSLKVYFFTYYRPCCFVCLLVHRRVTPSISIIHPSGVGQCGVNFSEGSHTTRSLAFRLKAGRADPQTTAPLQLLFIVMVQIIVGNTFFLVFVLSVLAFYSNPLIVVLTCNKRIQHIPSRWCSAMRLFSSDTSLK